jgi:hypothetical protein
MKRKLLMKASLLAVMIATSTPLIPAQADSGTPVKVLASSTVTGNRTMVKVSGATSPSGPLWTAKIPTSIKLSRDSLGYSGMVTFKFKNIASDLDGEEKSDVRITVALWSIGGKKIEDRTLYDWSPVSSTTDFEYRIFGSDGARPGKYVWLITTASSKYEGTGQLKIPVVIS